MLTGIGKRQIYSDLIEIYNIPCADVNTNKYKKLLDFVKDYPRKQRVAITGPLPVWVLYNIPDFLIAMLGKQEL